MPWTPPPNWPKPTEDGWSPHSSWQPDPSWGPAPDGWDFYPEKPSSMDWIKAHRAAVALLIALLVVIVVLAATKATY